MPLLHLWHTAQSQGSSFHPSGLPAQENEDELQILGATGVVVISGEGVVVSGGLGVVVMEGHK